MKYSRSSFSRFVPILLVVVITIVAIAAVIAIGRSLLGGGSTPDEPDVGQIDEGRAALLSSDISRAVRLTVRGPIVADEKFRSYQITVSPTSRNMTTYEGYLENPLKTTKLENSIKAYEELIYALDKRKMMDGRVLPEEQNDLRGVCATRKVYEYETLVNGETVKKLWASDCDGAAGSAIASKSEIIDMFLKQIPDGAKMVREAGLGSETSFFRL